MKKINLFYAMAAGSILMTGCATEQEMPKLPDNEAGKQLIVLSVANDNDNTRGGRPLLSSEADQLVDNVRLILTDANTGKVVWEDLIENWTDKKTDYAHGTQYTVEIKKEDFTLSTDENASYTLYALGYADDSTYDLSYYQSRNTTDKSDFDPNTAVALVENKLGARAEEIFAGEVAKLRGSENGVKASLVLHRQVAGTYGYLNEIPYVTTAGEHPEVGRYLHLIASNSAEQIVFGHFQSEDHENDAFNNENGSKTFAVNGLSTGNEQVVYTIDLMDWYKELKPEYDEEGNSTGVLDWKNGNWVNKTNYAYRKGSVFAATFIHPFLKTSGSTFKLVLTVNEKYDADDVLRTWTVTLPQGPQRKTYTLDFFSNGQWASNANAIDTSKIFNVLRNHLYTIGTKLEADPIDPNDPDPNPDPDPDPDPEDPDNPTPLNNKQEITIRVNSNWEVIHSTTIE